MSVASTPVPDSANAAGEMRLHGRLFVLARMGWITVALVVLGLDVLGTPDFLRQAQTTCVGSQCANNQITPVQLHDFLAAGLPGGFYAAYILVLYWIGTLVYVAIAAAIFRQRSDDRMALFGAFTLLTFGAGPVFGTLTALPRSNPVWSQAINLASLIGVTAFYVFFCLFPSGYFVPRWIRWVALAQASGSVAAVIPYAPLQTLVGGPAFFVFFGLLVFAQVYRYRRVSTPAQRQQTKWVMLGVALGLGGFLVVLGFATLPFGFDSGTALSAIFFHTLQAMLLWLIPIFIAIAILRSRLWDIDVVINRTLVYGSLTAILAALYFSMVIGAQAATQTLTGQTQPNPLIIVLSTLLIAALFTPLRQRIQRVIDRRFYRAKYDAARTLERFAATLRSDIDLADLREHLLGVVEETMQPAHVSLWLREPEQRSAGGAP